MSKKSISKSKKRRVTTDIPFFEFNLAEFPLFLLTKKAEKDSIEYEDEIVYQNRNIRRYWRVTWPVKDSNSDLLPVPPTSFVRKVFFVLLQNIAEKNFTTPIISFESRRKILKTIYKNREPSSGDFAQLDKAIFCLRNMVINAKNSFWNPDSKKIIEEEIEFDLFPERRSRRDINSDGTVEERSVQFVLSPTLYGSIKSGGYFWINANMNDLIELSDTGFRYIILLTKKSYHDNFLKRNLKDFIKQFPLYQSKSKDELTNTDLRKAKFRITEAHKELVEKGYIFDVPEPTFYKVNGEMVIQIPDLKCIQTKLDLPQLEAKHNSNLTYDEINELANKIAAVTEDTTSRGSWILIARNLPYDSVNQCIKDVEDAKRSGYVGNYGAIFTRYIQQISAELKINPWGKSGDNNLEYSNEKKNDNASISDNNLLEELKQSFGHIIDIPTLIKLTEDYDDVCIRKSLDSHYDHTTKLIKMGNLSEIAPERSFQIFEYYLKSHSEIKTEAVELPL